MPEPQPISCGNISQGMPLRRTNTIPLKQARSDSLGLPPLGLGIGGGNRDLINSHRSLGISEGAMINMPSVLENSFCVQSPNCNPMELPSFSMIE
jgi:hypothetical protein